MKATMDEEGRVVLIATNSLEHYALACHQANKQALVSYDLDTYLDVEVDEPNLGQLEPYQKEYDHDE